MAAALADGDDYLITAHQRADGDAIGALCAAIELLSVMGKRVIAVSDDDSVDSRYAFLTAAHNIVPIRHLPPDRRPARALILDAPVRERLGRVAAVLPPVAGILVVDHHHTDQPIGALHLKETAASSTCEILFRLAARLATPLNSSIANSLYTGIVFDTGRFRFNNTTPNCLTAAAGLVAAGADPVIVANRLYYDRSPSSVRLLGAALSSLVLEAGGRLASMVLSQDDLRQLEGQWEDLEGIIDYAISINGVDIAAFYKELKPGLVRISLRSRGEHSVRAIAQLLGGGGHDNAAGCQADGSPADVRARVNALIAARL